jgi:hypothetical protein
LIINRLKILNNINSLFLTAIGLLLKMGKVKKRRTFQNFSRDNNKNFQAHGFALTKAPPTNKMMYQPGLIFIQTGEPRGNRTFSSPYEFVLQTA